MKKKRKSDRKEKENINDTWAKRGDNNSNSREVSK
jgi:hypothetical protein